MVEIENIVEFQYGGRLGKFNGMSSHSHLPHYRVLPLGEFTVMVPEPHVVLQGAVTWRNQCHDHATLWRVRIPSAILKIVFRHIFGFFIKCNLGFDERWLSYRLRCTCSFINLCGNRNGNKQVSAPNGRRIPRRHRASNHLPEQQPTLIDQCALLDLRSDSVRLVLSVSRITAKVINRFH